jgi:hypothetical protein
LGLTGKHRYRAIPSPAEGPSNRGVEAETVDGELKVLLHGVRVVLVAFVMLVVLTLTLGPRFVHHPQPYGDGECTVTGSVGECTIR